MLESAPVIIPDQPKLTVVDPFAFSGPGAPPMPKEPPAVVPPAAPEMATPPTQVTPPPVPPQAPEQPTADVQQGEIDRALEGLLNPQQPIQWDDNAKKLFKDTYGEDDPLAYRDRIRQELAEKDTFKADAQKAQQLQSGLKQLEEQNPALHAAILLQLEGKDPFEYLAKLPNKNILGKQAKDLTDEQLIGTYSPDKVSPEEWRALKENSFAELNIDEDTLKYKIKNYRDLAEQTHTRSQQEHRQRIQSQEEGRRTYQENILKADAASIAQAQSDPFTKSYLTSEYVEQYRSGSLEKGILTLDDGVTPHPNRLTALTKAKHFDEAVRKAYERGLAKGVESGKIAAVSQMPDPITGGRAVTQPQQPDTRRPDVAYLDTLEQGFLKTR